MANKSPTRAFGDERLHRLLGDMARIAYETVREMMAAVDEPDTRPGMVPSSRPSLRRFHCIISTGVWAPDVR